MTTKLNNQVSLLFSIGRLNDRPRTFKSTPIICLNNSVQDFRIRELEEELNRQTTNWEALDYTIVYWEIQIQPVLASN